MKHRTLAVLVCGALLAALALGAWTSSSSGAEAEPPSGGMFFSLEVDGQTLTNFGELTGLVSGVDPDDLELQSRAGTPLRLPATRTPPSLMLKRGLTTDRALADWHEQALLDSATARKEAILTVFNQTATPVARYRLEKAWPAKIEVVSSAGPSSLALEKVTIVAERLTRVAP